MRRSPSHTKDTAGRAERLSAISGASSSLTKINTGSKGMKKFSKFNTHTGVADRRPKLPTKGNSLDVSDLLKSLTPKTSAPEEPKRGDAKRQLARDTLLGGAAGGIGDGNSLIPPPSASSSAGPKKSRAGRNQVLLEQGQAYASVAALASTSGFGAASSSFSQPEVDPFTLINAHLTTVINSAPPVDHGPAFVRPTKPTAQKPVNATHYKAGAKSHKGGKSSSNSKRR